MSYAHAFPYGHSPNPIGFSLNTASPTTASLHPDIRELSAQIARCPPHAPQAVHRLLMGGAEPDRPSNLYLATSRGDEATLRGLLELFERWTEWNALTKQQCHELLRGDGCQQGREAHRDCALAVAAARSDGLHRPLMLYYLRAYLGDRIRAEDFESLMEGWLPSSTAARSAALNSPRLTDCLRYFIHCAWAAYDEAWLGQSRLERMMALVGYDMRGRPPIGALDLRTGALKYEPEPTSSRFPNTFVRHPLESQSAKSSAGVIEPTPDLAKQRRRLLAHPVAPRQQAPAVHDHPADAARARRRLLAPSEAAEGPRHRYQDR